MNKRVESLRQLMKQEEIPAILVTSPYNLRYLTNFTGTTGLALITADRAFFVTDFRYMEQVAKQVEGYEFVQNKGPIMAEVARLIDELALDEVAFEEDYVSFATYSELVELFNCDLTPLAGLMESLREVKDDAEVAIMQKAIDIADAAFTHILDYIKVGMTEIQVANELDFYMRSLGASGVSFDTIVASGLRSAMPHGVASDKVIEQGDMITLDFGCYYQGYVSDMTRTFAIGDPGEKLKEIYQVVLAANEAVIAAAKAGVSGTTLDKIARKVIGDAGYGEAFGHGLGHGIGLEIHEGPAVSKGYTQGYLPGNVITDEPGIYLPGVGGVRIEDDLLITVGGNIVLTHSPKELIIL